MSATTCCLFVAFLIIIVVDTFWLWDNESLTVWKVNPLASVLSVAVQDPTDGVVATLLELTLMLQPNKLVPVRGVSQVHLRVDQVRSLTTILLLHIRNAQRAGNVIRDFFGSNFFANNGLGVFLGPN